VSKPPRRRRPAAPPSGLVGDHADKLSRIQPMTREVAEAVPAPPARPRIATRWYFAAALVLGALALFVLPTPFSGIASLACVGAFVTGGVRRINGGDPEMVKRTTTSGIVGGGG
jgi:predicted lipid-binding transport protein (Tim44 family)